VFERDLETIGAVALDVKLSVGASGLGLGLARALVVSGRVKPNAPDAISDTPVGGPAACLAGSCSQATLQQVASAERAMPVLHLDADCAVTGKDEARRALAWAVERLGRGPLLIASSSTPDQVAALQARHGRDAVGHAIEQAMADIAEGLVRSGVRRLVVAGGETSGAVVDRLGIPAFLVGAEIAAGVPVLRAVGAKAGAMLLALKSGNFGGSEFFSDALKLMR
jgi:3-dehydrotetronate 4-kinase